MQKKKNNNKEKVENVIIKDINEDTNQIKKFIIILVCVAVVSVLLYFISSKYLVKDGVSKDTEITPETISYNRVNVGNVFNRPYDEYYVLAYDPDSLEASYYSSLLNNFDITKADKMFFLDLSVEVNKKSLGDVSKKDAKKPSELVLKEPTLIKIKDGKIDKYLETREDIDKELNK